MAAKVANYGADIMRQVEKSLVLQLLDQTWKEHLLALDHLRQGIGLRLMGSAIRLMSSSAKAFNLFEGMLVTLRERVTQMLSYVELQSTPRPEDLEPRRAQQECTKTVTNWKMTLRQPAAIMQRFSHVRLQAMSIPTIRRLGAGLPGTSFARADRAKNTSIATVNCPDSKPDP